MPCTTAEFPDDEQPDDEGKLRRLVTEGEIQAFREAGRHPREGVVGVFRRHDAKVVALVELRCETDFVAKSAQFRRLADDLAMDVAVAVPLAETVEALLQQQFAPDPARGTVADLLAHAQSKDGFGETIVVARFDRWSVR